MKTRRNWRLAVVSSMLVILVSSKAADRDDAALVEGAAAQDPSGTHNMLVVGRKAVFLSHLPMFDGRLTRIPLRPRPPSEPGASALAPTTATPSSPGTWSAMTRVKRSPYLASR